MENIKKVTDANFFDELQKTDLLLLDFYAAWCGPCRMLSPILEEIANLYVGKLEIGKVDIDSEQRIAADFQVTSVPTLILFKTKKEVKRIVGLRDIEEIKEFISPYL